MRGTGILRQALAIKKFISEEDGMVPCSGNQAENHRKVPHIPRHLGGRPKGGIRHGRGWLGRLAPRLAIVVQATHHRAPAALTRVDEC